MDKEVQVQDKDQEIKFTTTRKEREMDTKIQNYKDSLGVSTNDRKRISFECKRIAKKLGIKSIIPREYLFLSSIAEKLKVGENPDLTSLALAAGYQRGMAENPRVLILKRIDPKLFSEIVGFDREDIEYELVKIMKQDRDLTAKMRSLELGSKILGIGQDDGKVLIQINSGIDVSD